MKVLIVEDDADIASAIRVGLEECGYWVSVCRDGARALRLIQAANFGIVLLDLMLPGMDGVEVCRRLREQGVDTPILMLTARDAVQDRVTGLDSGADDYLPKPFEFDELLARMRALFRRDKRHKSPVIKIQDLEIDTLGKVVRRSGKEMPLTPREYTLLEALAMNEGEVLTREVIQEKVWFDETSTSNTVDVTVKNLRRKVDAPYPVKLIQTIHGFGYALRPHESD